jgi:zinc transport system ATP-binding protein
MATPVLELRDVTLTRRGIPVLEDVDLTLRGGEFVGLIGPNGAGKTALLKVILGLFRPERGSVRVFGRPPRESRGLVAYVPQYAGFDVSYPVRVRDVVLMGRLGGRFRLRPSARDREAAERALDRVGLTALADRQVGRLSGGELQRVLVARALAQEASLLLLDEPTANLDTRVEHALYDVLGELPDDTTVILVSHDVGVMHRHVSAVACLNRRLHYHGTREITQEMIEATYGEGVDVLEHPHSHRLLHDHGGPER